MILAEVRGTVVATQKEPRLEGVKLLVVQPLSLTDLKPEGRPLVAVDSVGAGVGEAVLVVSGSSARQTDRTKETPVDATIMAIVDSVDVGGRRLYTKGR